MKILKYFFLLTLASCLVSCKKNDSIIKTIPISSLTFVNAIADANPIINDYYGNVDIANNEYSNAPVPYTTSFEYSVPSGNTPLIWYQTTDTIHAIYKGTVDFKDDSIYSLFLCGTIAQPGSLLTVDNPPYHSAQDSTMGIRFINLSFGSNPVSVDIQGKINGSEVTSLPYKNITGFKEYPATYKVSDYVFEFRDAVSGTLLASFTISGVNNGDDGDTNNNNYRYKNITIVLSGIPGGSGNLAQTTFQVNNY